MTDYRMPMAYIKKEACNDLTLGEFSAQWKALSEADLTTLREWANDEQRVLGIEVPA